MLEVRKLEAADEAAWRALWQGYVDFYDADVPADATAATFARLVNPASGLVGRVAVLDGTVVGFSASVLHPATWSVEPVCYLEDLFVAPAARRRGVGRALIEDLIGLARTKGWSRLYWHTRESNTEARRLYDAFAAVDDFVRYRLSLH